MLPEPEKLLRVALRPTEQMVSALVRIRPGKRLAVLGNTLVFAEAVAASCRQYCVKPELCELAVFSREIPEDMLSGAEHVLVPESYEKYCTAQMLEYLHTWESKGKLVRCAFEMDGGSLLFLAERLQQLKDKK